MLCLRLLERRERCSFSSWILLAHRRHWCSEHEHVRDLSCDSFPGCGDALISRLTLNLMGNVGENLASGMYPVFTYKIMLTVFAGAASGFAATISLQPCS
jgi:hypothetical protein